MTIQARRFIGETNCRPYATAATRFSATTSFGTASAGRTMVNVVRIVAANGVGLFRNPQNGHRTANVWPEE
jgi:hypothetical protein